MKTDITINGLFEPIDANKLEGWKVAKKVKSLRAKPLVNLLVDPSVLNKFLITTLEGTQSLGDGSLVCLGEAGDIWQQMPKKLLAKYNVTAIDKDGWMVCEPRPDNSIECIQWIGSINTTNSEHWLRSLWGEDVAEFGKCQRFATGDYICRNRTDNNDVWVVRKKFFENTYTIISE